MLLRQARFVIIPESHGFSHEEYVKHECAESGMKFYGEAKCHPDDEYSQAIGQHIAGNRLLDKYLTIRARVARRLAKDVSKTHYRLGKIAKIDRKKDW